MILMTESENGQDDRYAFFEYCAHCGRRLRVDEWHPVTSVDGDDRLYSFCDEECHTTWTVAE